ncbi:hypothetical protein [Flavobacterium sp.]|uniref:hypothetical protein n=1 Tax=Flavobacterium sp. TaxID=239 RepID=UPI00374CDCA2
MIDVGYSEYSDGLGFGLNKKAKKNGGKGTKLGRFLRKNVNLQNTIKATSLVASFVPVVGGVASKGLNLVSKLGAVGRLGTKALALSKTQLGQLVMSKAKAGLKLSPQETQVATSIVVANETDPNTPNVLTQAELNVIAPQVTQAVAPMFQPAQQEFQDEPQGDVVPVKISDKNEITTPTPLQTEPKNNTMLYVGVGVVLLGLGTYALTHKNK